MKKDKVTGLIAPLADALQMRLGVHQPSEGGPSSIVQIGNLQRQYKPFFGMSVDIRPEIKASYKGEKTTAVLVRIKGDLYLYLVYYSPADELVAAVVDASIYPMLPKNLTQIEATHPREAIKLMEPGVRAVYRRKQYVKTWQGDNGPIGLLDGGQGVAVGQGGGSPD